MMFLFDTDVLIDILRKRTETIFQIEDITPEADELACSTITVAELFAGMRKEEEEDTRNLLKCLKKIDLTEEIAETAGSLKKKTKSHQLYLDDCVIAATALKNAAMLFTKNYKDYPFRELKIYRVH